MMSEKTNSHPKPEYYSRGIEPWEVIKANRLGFFRGNALKYLLRADAKNGLEDLKKCRAYLDEMIQQVEKGERHISEL